MKQVDSKIRIMVRHRGQTFLSQNLLLILKPFLYKFWNEFGGTVQKSSKVVKLLLGFLEWG